MTTRNKAVFLDVDGVINSLTHLFRTGNVDFSEPTQPYHAGLYTIWVPDYVKSLVRAMWNSVDLYWLTTWRGDANKYVSPILGVPTNIPVIDDGTSQRNVGWKGAASWETADRLIKENKTVYWIEDFGRAIPLGTHLDIITVDTATKCEDVLLPQHLPLGLMHTLIESGGYEGPTYVNPPKQIKNLHQVRN